MLSGVRLWITRARFWIGAALAGLLLFGAAWLRRAIYEAGQKDVRHENMERDLGTVRRATQAQARIDADGGDWRSKLSRHRGDNKRPVPRDER